MHELTFGKPYKLPSIVRAKNDWFLKYFYQVPGHSGKFKEFRLRKGVNRIKDLNQREKAIGKLQKAMTYLLKNGLYSPFGQQELIRKRIEKKEAQLAKKNQHWTLKKGLDEFIRYCEWKELAEKTIKTYKSFANTFEAWLIETKQINNPACEYLETDYRLFVDSYYDAEDWSPRTYNNYVKFMQTLFGRIQALEKKISRNVRYEIHLHDLELKNDKAEKNRAYSGLVADKVKDLLSAPEHKIVNPFIKFIYFSCMRPKEIRMLQVQHIDLRNRQIKVIGPTGKTGDRFVPISDELMQLLRKLKVDQLPLGFYLFGKGGKPDAQMCGPAFFSNKYKLIKEELGLDIHIYTMYGWKHTRVIDLLSAGFRDEEVMKLTGHKDYQGFMAYKRDLVVDNKVMKGKTIGW